MEIGIAVPNEEEWMVAPVLHRQFLAQTYHLWSKDMRKGWSWENGQKLIVNNHGYDAPCAATEIVEQGAGDLMSYYFWDLEKRTFLLRLVEIGWEGPVLYVKY